MSSTLMAGAYEKLRRKLESGELAPGAQLVNRKLGEELGVSTVTLREAIHRLTSEGLVEHIPNAGAFVRKLSRREVTELYKVRNALEMLALDEAFARIDEEQLAELQQICDDWRKLARSIRKSEHQALEGEFNQRWIANDIKFHRILVDAADNVWLKKVIADLHLTSRIARTKPAITNLSDAAKTYRMHVGILRALRKRDLNQARSWMTYHNTVGLADARQQAFEG